MISIAQLQYIIAVDTHRHFATAAEHCFVTQPTLSMQIKKLEDDLDVKIFDRSKQPVVPTDLGERFIAQARVVLSEYQKLTQLTEDFSNTVAGELRIGIIPTLAGILLPRFLGDFSRAYPDVQVKAEERQTHELIQALRQDTLDVAIAVTPLADADMKYRPLFYEEIIVYAHEGHNFLQEREVQVQELASPDIWLMGEGHCFRSQVLNLCAYRQDLPYKNFQYTSGSLDTLKRLVDSEGGFTLLPELYSDYLSAEEQDRLRRVHGVRPVREVSLIYSRNFVKERLLSVLEKHIKEAVPPTMAMAGQGQVVEWV